MRQGNTDEMHRAQRILLDTLHVLHKGALCTNNNNTTTTTRRFQEGVVFASQVLHHGYYIRHLDSNEQRALRPLADHLYTKLQQVRHLARAQALAYLTNPTHLLITRLNELMNHYDTFESALYASYSRAVFGDSKTTLWQNANQPLMTNNSNNALPAELFCDALTQLLPMSLDRALAQKLVTLDMLQDLDPVAFIAMPRLAVLAGTTWLSHISQWRKHHQHPCLVAWFNTGGIRHDMVTRLLNAIEQLESTTSPAAFMEHHLRIEHALVYGWDDQPTSLESTIYTHVCAIADGLRSGNNARSFNMVLRHLFSPFHPPPPPESTQYDDMYPESVSESTVLELAI